MCLSPCSHFHEVFWEVSYLVGRVCLSSSIDYYHGAPQSCCIPVFTFSLARYSVSLYFFQHLMLFYSTVFMNLMHVKWYLICTFLMNNKMEDLFYISGFSSGSGSKESVCNAGDPSLIPGSGRSLEKERATHSSTLAWRIPWAEKLGRLLDYSP